MRGSIVVLGLAISPFVARASMAQRHSHVRRHDFPAVSRDRDDDNRGRDDDKKCEDRRRGNPSENGREHRADPHSKGNKDCAAPAPAPDPAPAPAPQPPPPPPAPSGHTSFTGFVFYDLDLNGVMGPDENGLSGWTVQISGPMTQTAVTDGNGQYTFSGLTAGSYTICVLAPAGWNQVFPTSGPACAAGIGYTQDAPALAGDVLFDGVDFGFVSAHW